MTVNLLTNKDDYPFPNIEELLCNAPESYFFSKIDLKSAYHQVPQKEGDKQFTAHENVGLFSLKFHKFNGPSFRVNNAVPAFQRIINKFNNRNKLEGTYPYLDDRTIGERFKEEHKKILKKSSSRCRKRRNHFKYK